MIRNCVLLVLLTAGLSISFRSTAQNGQTQSAVYDAEAILNVEHGLNTLIMPVGSLYKAIDPLTGTPKDLAKGNNVDTFINNAVTGRTILLAILRRNAGLAADAPEADVVTAYEHNPFLNGILANAVAQDPAFAAPAGKIYTPPGSGGAGSNLLGNVANGTADFLIKRAEDELSIAIFSKLQQFLARYPEFNTLFPQTCALISKVESYNFSNILTTLKNAIQADLTGFVGKIPALYQLPKYKTLNGEFPALTLVFTASTLVNELDSRHNISATLRSLGSQPYLAEQNNYASVIQTICLLSNSIQSKLISDPEEGDYPYITTTQIRTFTHGDAAMVAEYSKYYLGLVYQQIGKKLGTIHVSAGTTQSSVQDLLTAWLGHESEVVTTITALGTKMRAADSLLTALKKTDEGAAAVNAAATKHPERYTLYAELAGEAFQLVTPFIKGTGAHTGFAALATELSTYWNPLTSDAINMANAFGLKQYDLGMEDLSKLLGTLSQFLDAVEKNSAQARQLKDKVVIGLDISKTAVTAAITNVQAQIAALPQPNAGTPAEIARNMQSSSRALADSVKTLQSQQADLDKQQKTVKESLTSLSKILQYISLLASISEAQNSQEVENLLESIALPAGSSRIKKVTYFNIAVNAYVGGFSRSGVAGSGFTNKYGLTAPIGFTFSNGWGKAGSISLFAGVFDIGGIIQYKLNNEGAYEQNVSLAGLVSPSIELAYGFPFYLPISVGCGWQWTSPATNPTNNINLSSHFNAFIGVDIPLFNLTAIKKKG